MSQPFGFTHVISRFVPPVQDFKETIQGYSRALEAMGGEMIQSKQMDSALPLLYFIDTGGTEETLLNIREQRANTHPHEEVLLIAHPGYNSLPAALEVLARLQQDQTEGRIFFLNDSTDTEGLTQISDYLKDRATSQKLSQARIGLIGDPSSWLVASSPKADILKQTWGPSVISIEMQELTRLMGQITKKEVEPVLMELVDNATGVQEPSAKELNDVVVVYQALKQIIEKYELTALTVRCFDLVLELKTTGCFALSQLIDEGHISGCEGDLVSTVGMLWAQELLGETPWMANPASLDEEKNTLLLAHCTVPRKLVQDYGLRSHFESGLGVGIQGRIDQGPVTLLRIGGKQMEALWLGEGHIEKAGKAEDLCRTQVEIKLSSGVVQDLLRSPLGNHIVMIQGHHATRLKSWWESNIGNKVSSEIQFESDAVLKSSH